MQKRLVCTVLNLVMIAGVLAGCGGTTKETTSNEDTQSTVENVAEAELREELKEELREELKEELKKELVEDTESEPMNIDGIEVDFESEELESDDSGEDDEFNAHLSAYLDSLDQCSRSFKTNGDFNASYFADDINEDGYPEVFQFRYRDVNAEQREFGIIMHYMTHYWDVDLREEVYLAKQTIAFDMIAHNMSADFGYGGCSVSYTKGEEGILSRYDTCSGLKDDKTTHIALNLYRDNEILYGGEAKKWDIENHIEYQVFDGMHRMYNEEADFNNFDSDSTYETTIKFGEDEAWSTWQEAIEHLGELP